MFSGNTLSKSRKPLEQKDVFDLITSTGDIRTTTKKWAQSSDCASWRVPADSVYFIAGQISNMIGCDLLDYIQGRIEVGNNPVAYAGVGSTTGTHTIQVSTIQKLKEGDMVRMDPWTGAADKKVKACLHIVRMLNLSGGGGTVAHSLFREGGRHGWHNREGEYETNNPGRTGSSGNHQSQTDLSEPGRNLHTGLSDLGIIGTGSGYCVLGNIESLDESATKLLCPRILWSRENPQNGFRTQGRQRCLFTSLGDLIGGGLYA